LGKSVGGVIFHRFLKKKNPFNKKYVTEMQKPLFSQGLLT
jgi:hypothetical protein